MNLVATALNNAGRAPSDAPKDGTEFLGLLSNGRYVVLSHPENLTGWHDMWVNDAGYGVPFPETICPDSRPEFFHLVEWWEFPKDVAETSNAKGMRDSRYASGAGEGDL